MTLAVPSPAPGARKSNTAFKVFPSASIVPINIKLPSAKATTSPLPLIVFPLIIPLPNPTGPELKEKVPLLPEMVATAVPLSVEKVKPWGFSPAKPMEPVPFNVDPVWLIVAFKPPVTSYVSSHVPTHVPTSACVGATVEVVVELVVVVVEEEAVVLVVVVDAC